MIADPKLFALTKKFQERYGLHNNPGLKALTMMSECKCMAKYLNASRFICHSL